MYKSENGNVLITQDKNQEKTMITFESYPKWSKWSSAYLIKPDGTVEKFEPDEDNQVGEQYYAAWDLHAVNPRVFVEIANTLGFGYDQETFDEVIRHCVNEWYDGEISHLLKSMPEIMSLRDQKR